RAGPGLAPRWVLVRAGRGYGGAAVVDRIVAACPGYTAPNRSPAPLPAAKRSAAPRTAQRTTFAASHTPERRDCGLRRRPFFLPVSPLRPDGRSSVVRPNLRPNWTKQAITDRTAVAQEDPEAGRYFRNSAWLRATQSAYQPSTGRDRTGKAALLMLAKRETFGQLTCCESKRWITGRAQYAVPTGALFP